MEDHRPSIVVHFLIMAGMMATVAAVLTALSELKDTQRKIDRIYDSLPPPPLVEITTDDKEKEQGEAKD